MPTKVPMKVHKRGVSARTTNAFIVSGESADSNTCRGSVAERTRNSPMAFCRRSGKGIIDVFCPATTNMTARVINVGSTPITRAGVSRALSVVSI